MFYQPYLWQYLLIVLQAVLWAAYNFCPRLTVFATLECVNTNMEWIKTCHRHFICFNSPEQQWIYRCICIHWLVTTEKKDANWIGYAWDQGIRLFQNITLIWFWVKAVTVTTSFKRGATLHNSSYCLSKDTSSALLISGNLNNKMKCISTFHKH